MIFFASLAFLALLAPTHTAAMGDVYYSVADGSQPGLVKGSLGIERGSEAPLWIPAGEWLEFRVEVDLGLLGDSTVGKVTMSSGVEPFVSGLPLPGQTAPGADKLVGWVKYTAKGKQFGSHLDNTLSTRFQPLPWPRSIHNETKTGSKNRRREVKIGVLQDRWTSEYRADDHCHGCERKEHFVTAALPWSGDHHCHGCERAAHRKWGDPTRREVPPQALDVLGTVYFARNLVRNGKSELTTMMVRKNLVWKMTFRAGKLADIRVPAGTFPCRQVLLSAVGADGEDTHGAKFPGLFGIQGDLVIWMNVRTGVPVMIEGEVRAGSLMNLHAKIGLKKYEGTPAAFRPLL